MPPHRRDQCEYSPVMQFALLLFIYRVKLWLRLRPFGRVSKVWLHWKFDIASLSIAFNSHSQRPVSSPQFILDSPEGQTLWCHVLNTEDSITFLQQIAIAFNIIVDAFGNEPIRCHVFQREVPRERANRNRLFIVAVTPDVKLVFRKIETRIQIAKRA